MLSLIAKPIVRILGNPFFWAILLISALLVAFFNRDRWLNPELGHQQQIEQDLESWRKEDPAVARIQAEIQNDRAMAIAYQSAMLDDYQRSTTHSMVEEWRESEAVPYRVQLAALALDDPDLKRMPERAEQFFIAHGSTCEFLAYATGVESSHDYLSMLKQAQADQDVWRLVWDDPVALQVWANSEGLEETKYYRKHRDWLADSLVALDYRDSPISGPAEVIQKLSAITDTARITLSEDEADLGVVGLMALLSHGNLIDRCRQNYGIKPEQTVSILYMNPDVFDGFEGDRAWVIEKASWLNDIEKNSPSVWLSAMEYPFTLRLYIDAPHVSEDLLAKHGSSMPQFLIYDLFQDDDGNYNPAVITRAAEAVNAFGDLAIYVFARYNDPLWRERLEQLLLDDEIGVRLIPFMVRFNDKGFDRIESDMAWLDKYYEKDGTPIIDPTAWVANIPGGALYKVAENWSKGLPNEGSELGWAAFDVADIALTVMTFGSSKAVTTAGKAAGAIDKGADLARAGSKTKIAGRATEIARWSERVKEVGKRTAKNLGELKDLLRQGKVGKASIEFTWLGLTPALDASQAVVRSTHGGLQKWKAVNPTTKKWVYRAALGTSLFIQLSNRTIPNTEEIGMGIGKMVGNWAAALTKGAGLALANAFTQYMTEMTGLKIEMAFYTAIAVIGLLAFLMLFMGFRQLNQKQITIA